MKTASSPKHRYGFPQLRGVSVDMRFRVIYDESEIRDGETLFASKGEAMDTIYPNRPKNRGRFGPLFTGETIDPGHEWKEPIGFVIESWTAEGRK